MHHTYWFKNIKSVLSEKGTLIIEDPSLLECLKTNTYDQFYNEHIYVFSALALKNIINGFGLELFNITKLKTHGGSLRYYIKIKSNNKIKVSKNVSSQIKDEINNGLNKFLNNKRQWCIIKLSPLSSNQLIDSYYKIGFRQFHCCNTIPIKQGGLSGKSIQPYSLRLIHYLRNNYKDVEIIAGGGIQSSEDIRTYKNNGANYFSISTLLFNPYKFAKFYFQNVYKWITNAVYVKISQIVILLN